jgi:hypothetical protein
MAGRALSLSLTAVLHGMRVTIYLYHSGIESLVHAEGRKWASLCLVLVAAVLV